MQTKTTSSFFSIAWLGGVALSLALGAGCGSKSVVGHDAGAGQSGSDAAAGSDGGVGDAPVACPAGGTGQLMLVVNGLPTGTVPMVRIMGGTLKEPTLVPPGAPFMLDAGGGYSLAWRRVKVAPVAPALIGKAYYLANMPFDGCINATGTTTVTLEYAQEPGSEKLWMTVSDPPVMIVRRCVRS